MLTLEPLTTVKDLVIVGDGPAAEEIFQYCEDQTVRGYRFCGVFNDGPIEGPLGAHVLGTVDALKRSMSSVTGSTSCTAHFRARGARRSPSSWSSVSATPSASG